MNVAQLIISIPLFLFLAFGIGFILNMLLKTTWVPVVVYLALVAYLFFDKGRLLMVDYVILSSGLIGAVLSGWAIHTLRRKGYRMF
ncbi:YuiB family protein [Bacillaceae bacterium]